MKRLIILIIFAALVWPVSQAVAVGIAIKPQALEMTAVLSQKTSEELLVSNVFSEPAMYEIKLETADSAITLSPENFRLLPQESQVVKIEFLPKRPGRKNSNLLVVARPLDTAALVAGTGVKIPLILNVKIFTVRLIIALAIGSCLALLVVVKLISGFLMKKNEVN